MSVRVHIERIVLHDVGLAACGEREFRDALAGALQEAIAGGIAQPLTCGPSFVERLSAPAITLRQGGSPAQLGHALADAIHGGIGR